MESIVYKKILVTHDGSLLASAAIPHALALAKCLKAEIVLLHVVHTVAQESVEISSAGMAMCPVASDFEAIAIDKVKENKNLAKQQLEELKEAFLAGGINNVQICIHEGTAQDTILEIAKTKHCDLIIMSTHGRSGLKRALLGSVTDHVVRHAPCPVLVIHPQREGHIIQKNVKKGGE